MKKIFYLMMTCLMAFVFVACEHNHNNEPTPDPEKDSFTFVITVSEVTATSANVVVTPTDDSTTYYFDLITAEEFAEVSTSLETLTTNYVEYFNMVLDYYAEYGITMEDILSVSEDGYDFTGLSPETNYVAFAFRFVDNKADVLVSKEFTTPAVERSNMTFEYVVTDTAVFIVPSNEDETYFSSFIETDTLTAYGYTADTYAPALYSYLTEYYGSYFGSYYEYQGTVFLRTSKMNGSTEFFTCGSTNGVQTTDWFFFTYPSIATVTKHINVHDYPKMMKLANAKLAEKVNFVR